MHREPEPQTEPLMTEPRPLSSPTKADSLSRATGPGRTCGALVLLAASLVLIAFNLRCALASVGPVLPEIIRDLGLSPAGASALTTLPTLCFGLFGLLAPTLSRRLGTERALMIVLGAIVLGTALRGVTGTAALFAGQTLACAGIAAVNVLLPGLVKRDFSKRAAVMTGLYVMSLSVGAAIAAGATVPLESRFGGSWTSALAFWALPAALAAALWVPQLSGATNNNTEQDFVVRGLWSDALAWQVTLFMGLQSSFAYIVFGWLAPILRDRGFGPVQAGLIVSVMILAQAAGSLFAPSVATLGADQRLATAISCLLFVGSFLGCVFAWPPSVWLWSVILGLSGGAVFAIAITLIVLRAPDIYVAANLSGMSQSVGYMLASIGPFLAGVLHGWSGGWNGLAWLSLILGAAMLASGIGASRAMHVGAVCVRVSLDPPR
jgi:CP family cyanate transporter-like MFS transporter